SRTGWKPSTATAICRSRSTTGITDTEPDQCTHLPGMVQSAFFQIMRRCDMSVYGLAAQMMQQALEQGQQAGYGEQELARALMTEVLAVYKRGHTPPDIAHEPNYLAETLDEDQDYAFMRP